MTRRKIRWNRKSKSNARNTAIPNAARLRFLSPSELSRRPLLRRGQETARRHRHGGQLFSNQPLRLERQDQNRHPPRLRAIRDSGLPVLPSLCKLHFVNAAEILKTLRELTERKEIEFLPLAKDLEKLPQWPPAARYIRVLSEGTKPETASEDLFTALCKELLKIEPSRQVIVRDGWVDFRVTEPNARPIPFELKSLFRRDGDSLRRYDANPDHYKDQIKNYHSEHEYLVLTDLRTTWLCSARD